MELPIDELDILDLTVAEAQRLIDVLPDYDELIFELRRILSGTAEESWIVIRIRHE